MQLKFNYLRLELQILLSRHLLTQQQIQALLLYSCQDWFELGGLLVYLLPRVFSFLKLFVKIEQLSFYFVHLVL